MQTETEIQKLIALLKDLDDDVRYATIIALMQLGSKEAIPYLIDLLFNDPSWVVRSNAAEALGQLGAKEAIKHLIALLFNDPSLVVRRSAVQALGKLGAKEAIPQLIKLQNDPDDDVRCATYLDLDDKVKQLEGK